MRQIAFYGKGGIGKSTTTSNVSAALADMGYKVMQVGCDPKADSTRNLVGGRSVPTILDTIRAAPGNDGLPQTDIPAMSREEYSLDDIVFEGYGGIVCCEAGGPEPGVGCAGRGVITAIEMLRDMGAYEQYKPDFVLYDVLGDVVCGGFAMPIRQGLASEIYSVTSGEMMSIFASNNIFKGIQRFAARGPARLSGIVANSRNTNGEAKCLNAFASATGTKVIEFIPRDNIVHECEMMGKTVIEGAPDSEQAQIYRSLAEKVVQNKQSDVPAPMTHDELRDWMISHGMNAVQQKLAS